MKQSHLIIAFALLLSACKAEKSELPVAIEMTPAAVGFYCQMDLLNHDGPKGQIHLDGMGAPLFFSQVKDAIAYFHMPEQNFAVQVMYVQDMANAKDWSQPGAWIPAVEAYYVIDSDQMGGMGAPEFVPFSEEKAATEFMEAHGGRLLHYAQIKAEDVLGSTETTAVASATPDSDAGIAERLQALSSTEGTN